MNTKFKFDGPPENRPIWERLWKEINTHCAGKHTVFAEKIGVAGGTFQPFATGKRIPNPNILISIYKTFNTDINWLLTGEKSPKRTNPENLDNIDLSKFQSPDSRLEELSQEEKTLLLKVLLEDREDHRERLKILEDYIEYLRGLLEKNRIEHYPLNKRSGT